MSWQSDIFDALQANSSLTTMIGDRLSWDVADGSTPAPYLIIQVISGNGETDFDGKRELTFPLIQLTAWAKGNAACIEIASIIKRELEGVNLPGANNVSLGYAGEQSTHDPQTKLNGQIIEYRVSANSN